MQTLRWQLDDSVRRRVRTHAVEIHDVRVEDSGRAYRELTALGRRLHERWAETPVGRVEGVSEARRLYRNFGVDPTRTRPSSEALLQRCRKGLDLYRINEAVDVGNWVSLEFLLPLGLYARDRIVGDVATVRVGDDGEEYEGIRKGPVHLAGRLCVADGKGAFGSPTSDSARTCVTERTTNLAAIVFAPENVDPERLGDAGRVLASRLADYCGGTVVLDEAVGG
jgi:DNA/RNA-binding domain of Phe-tRNA-synthetase-like protein